MLSNFLKLLLCFIAGSASFVAMAPSNFWPILFVTISGFYYLLSKAPSTKSAFLYGFVFSYGYFFFSLSWVSNALLIEYTSYGWAYPIALFGLPLILNTGFAIAAALIWRFFDLSKISGYLGFAALFSLSEWVRGHWVFGGFPWNSFGYTWADLLPIAQIVWLDNIYLLTWLTLIWSSLIGFIVLYRGSQVLVCAIVSLSLVACYIYGDFRLSKYTPEFHEDIDIKIVQANIAQEDKWAPEKFRTNLLKHTNLSAPSALEKKTTYIIWPETTLNPNYTEDPASMIIIKDALKSYEGAAHLLTGMLRYFPEKQKSYNSIVMIDQDGAISNVYDKHHLVPFGEYMPFQKWIPFGPVANFFGFTPGPGPQTLQTPSGLSYSPQVCYEVIFPSEAIATNTPRPDFMLNVANDAWYGRSAGPHQHYTQSVFRSIELGIPMIRSTSTGVSAVIDPVGHTLKKSGLFEETVLISALPKKITAPKENNPLKGNVFYIFIFISLAARFLKLKL